MIEDKHRFLKYLLSEKAIFILLLSVFFNSKVIYAQEGFDEFITLENISLENIYSQRVSVSLDESENFIVTNAKSKKVCVFNSGGQMLFEYGSIGKGPGDFLQPITTIRLSSGRLLTAELAGKLSLFNSRGDSLMKIFNIKVLPFSEVHQISEDKILIVGRKMFEDQVKLLHLFDLKGGVIMKSFLDLPFSIGDYGGDF
ncbi:hypothetical protein [Fodinibius saliphilus]|uniref:hypothetical protein n=1 Tax=Fodinibius saliphilus TaxID=1920650 RepID=UPI001107F367|nr:hypothetical protein [Fodinibius saliphilus]